MKQRKVLTIAAHFMMASLMACGGPSSSSGTAPALYTCTASASSNVYPGVPAALGNTLQVTVNGSTCSGNTSYQNEPCAAVTICDSVPNCTTINDILIDTGSYGLRVFKGAINSTVLTNLMTAQENDLVSGKLAECVVFGDLSSEFGPVVKAATVQLGSETASNVPMMIIDSTYSGGGAGTPCSSSQSTPDTSAATTGFNGILGVGVLKYDGGSYYACNGTTCGTATMTVGMQVQNPVALFAAVNGATDNNGTILTFPSISSSGASSVTGYLIFGINTRTNNQTTNVNGYAANGSGEIETVFGVLSSPSTLPSFIDSGSNAYYFPSPSQYVTPDCGNGFFCPTTQLSLTAMNMDINGGKANCVTIPVANTNVILATNNNVFNNLAGNAGSGINGLFDMGLPFFFGREIFIGIKGGGSVSFTSGNVSGPFFGY